MTPPHDHVTEKRREVARLNVSSALDHEIEIHTDVSGHWITETIILTAAAVETIS